MSEFVPARFEDLVRQLYGEVRVNGALFGLPRRKWYLPAKDELNLSVRFHDQIAGNPSGPAAGPHTQLAQNLLLSYVAGGRMLEFKTVQINDSLAIPRPCIDMATIGFNVEWSQELKIEQTIREYVAGMMLIEIFRNDAAFAGESLKGVPGNVIFDMSVGYSLDGIRSDRMAMFFDTMRNAASMIESLRSSIPDEFSLARQLPYSPRISHTVTLSTFHGCPAEEIEKICEFLLETRDLNVIVKMNPPMLGQDRLEHLLHEVMGYQHINVNPAAYETGLQFDDAVQLVHRLTSFAKQRGKCFGCKFSNTLEVMNDARVFGAENKTQYLSGPPLHVMTMTLTDLFRQAVGGEVPISFSAGIDSKNFADAVACGFVPVTTCSDLLKPGGYGRLPAYLKSLADAMRKVRASTINEFIKNTCESPASRAAQELENTHRAAVKAQQDLRYRYPANSRAPKRVESDLETFDCLTCDKCIPVCPNASNFVYHTTPTSFDYQDWIIHPDGSWTLDSETKQFRVEEPCQIANFADFCNACGNCDTFCPEYGGPFIKKPQFFGSIETWQRSCRDGFAICIATDSKTINGRIRGQAYSLAITDTHCRYADEMTSITCNPACDQAINIELAQPLHKAHRVDRGILFTLQTLLLGVSDFSHITPVNAPWLRGR